MKHTPHIHTDRIVYGAERNGEGEGEGEGEGGGKG